MGCQRTGDSPTWPRIRARVGSLRLIGSLLGLSTWRKIERLSFVFEISSCHERHDGKQSSCTCLRVSKESEMQAHACQSTQCRKAPPPVVPCAELDRVIRTEPVHIITVQMLIIWNNLAFLGLPKDLEI